MLAPQEARMAAKLLKKRFKIQNVNEWLKDNDENMDGKLNFKEFYNSLKSALELADLSDEQLDD